MMRCSGAFTLAGLLVAAPAAHAAQGMNITIDEDVAQQLGLDAADLETSMGGAIQDELHLGSPGEFLGAMAQASALATKGMGVDYASNFEHLVFGGSVGSGVSEAGATFNRGGQEMPSYGFSFQVSGMAGLSMGILSGGEGFPSRIRLFVNGMAMSTGGDSFKGHLANVGGHLQFALVKPTEGQALTWGGLAFTGGYEHAQYRLELQQAMPISAPSSGVDVSWDATGSYVMKAATDSIPLELSTNLHLLMFTAFVGGAYDLNSGVATNAIELDGDIEADALGETTRVGHATVSSIEQAGPVAGFPRLFGGLQADIFMVKAYGQLNMGLQEGFGGHVGVRVAL